GFATAVRRGRPAVSGDAAGWLPRSCPCPAVDRLGRAPPLTTEEPALLFSCVRAEGSGQARARTTATPRRRSCALRDREAVADRHSVGGDTRCTAPRASP